MILLINLDGLEVGLMKFTSLRSKDRVNSVYYDIYLGGRSIRGTDMPDKAIKILRKFGK
jgi:hypothetical protein